MGGWVGGLMYFNILYIEQNSDTKVKKPCHLSKYATRKKRNQQDKANCTPLSNGWMDYSHTREDQYTRDFLS